jgi:PAS domain S-box-containing protein
MAISTPVRAPELVELETLVVCATEGSLAAAGEVLGISRPAVAKRIRSLEALAGCPLLSRGGRGVSLTDAGASLLDGARRMLDESDSLVGVLTDLRAQGPSPIAGLRELVGYITPGQHASSLPETRLVETERVLSAILKHTKTAIVLSDPETAAIHEVNDAFCEFAGLSREQLLGLPSTEHRAWYDSADRARIVEQLEQTGGVEEMAITMARSDGSSRRGVATVVEVVLAGKRLWLGLVEDLGTGAAPSEEPAAE